MSSDQLKGLAHLLVLQQRMRQTQSLQELRLFLVNDTRLMFNYRTACLLEKGKLTAVSGLPAPIKDAPFTQWIEQLCAKTSNLFDPKMRELVSIDFPEDVAEEWNEYVPSHLLWMPMLNERNEEVACLLLARDEPWKVEEQRLLVYWVGTAGHAIQAIKLRKQHWWQSLSKKMRSQILTGSAAILTLLLIIPVRMTVIVSAEVVPRDPFIVRAPMDGVIGEVMVAPNQEITRGTVLVQLDESSLNSRNEVARQELEVARAEYMRAEQTSIIDRTAASQRYLLNSRIEQRNAELEYVKELLTRSKIESDVPGLVMIEDTTELRGRPVKVGEKILTIANPDSVELEAWMPVDDSLPLEVGAELEFYLNVAPGNPIKGTVERLDYQAQVSPEGFLAFRIRAALDGQTLPRIGLRGSARVYGESVSLFYYLMRKPLASLRRITGI